MPGLHLAPRRRHRLAQGQPLMPAPTYSELQMAVTLMFVLLLIVSLLALDPPEKKP